MYIYTQRVYYQHTKQSEVDNTVSEKLSRIPNEKCNNNDPSTSSSICFTNDLFPLLIKDTRKVISHYKPP